MEFQEYLHFLESLRQELEALTAIERKKIEAIRTGDLDALNECMKQEQAASLSLRGHEQRRTELLRALGLEQVPLRELSRHAPAELKGEAAQTAERMMRTYQVLSSAQSSARTLMEKDLHQIEKQLERQAQQGKVPPAAQPSQKTDFRA